MKIIKVAKIYLKNGSTHAIELAKDTDIKEMGKEIIKNMDDEKGMLVFETTEGDVFIRANSIDVAWLGETVQKEE